MTHHSMGCNKQSIIPPLEDIFIDKLCMPLPRGVSLTAGPEPRMGSDGLGDGQVVVVGFLSLKQAPVSGDLLLQPRLDVHELLILEVLALSVSTHIAQLGFDAADHTLDL